MSILIPENPVCTQCGYRHPIPSNGCPVFSQQNIGKRIEMTPRKQLEYAAKAIGLPLHPGGIENSWRRGAEGVLLDDGSTVWNPLTSQADSDRMACDLEIAIRYYDDYVSANTRKVERIFTASVGHDNTIEGRRRAVREARMAVAVEIGKGMK